MPVSRHFSRSPSMTGQAMDGDREKCLETGMDDYIIKPINKEIVLEVIQKWGHDTSP